eukprot:COSAG01_NODE_392_length_17668_cov_5.382264_3_plen_125_part_00
MAHTHVACLTFSTYSWLCVAHAAISTAIVHTLCGACCVATEAERVERAGSADFARHFTPPYEPWDQRLCLSPGGDFYAALRSGRASVTTGTIQRFTERGILMEGGEAIEVSFPPMPRAVLIQQC